LDDIGFSQMTEIYEKSYFQTSKHNIIKTSQ